MGGLFSHDMENANQETCTLTTEDIHDQEILFTGPWWYAFPFSSLKIDIAHDKYLSCCSLL